MSRLPRTRRALLVGMLVAGASAVPGLAPIPVAAAPAAPSAPSVAPPALDPGVLGPEPIEELAYDLGDEAFQPEGFPGRVELRGKVYAPQTIATRAPVAVLVHGRHVTCGATDETVSLEWPCPAGTPEIPSYQGYDALGRNLASHGIVAVSIGANGVNGNDGFVDDGGAAARGQLVMETLRRFQAWDASATGSPFGARFVGRLDLSRVGLMGHSRGGEGVVAAAELNQRIGSPFGVRAVLPLAPVDFARRVLGGVALNVILPYCDGDVFDLQGSSYYDDSRYASPGDPAPKSTTLLYGANHNYFNTVWTTGVGATDDAGYENSEFPGQLPSASPVCGPTAPGRLSGPAQEQAGAALMAGFLRRHLQDEVGFERLITGTAPYPASTGPARWSTAYHAPVRLDVERWDGPMTTRTNRAGQIVPLTGASPGLVCNPYLGDWNFDPNSPITRCPGQVWLSSTNDTNIFDVGWTSRGAVIRQPLGTAGVDASAYDGVRLRVAVGNDARNRARARQDFSVVLEDTAGNRASVAVDPLTNALARLTPGLPQHALLNGVRVPFSSFAGVDLTRLRAVELRFDRTPAGRVQLADLALTAEGTGDAVGPTDGAVPVASGTPACRRTPANRWACTLGHVLVGRDLTSPELAVFAKGYGTAASRAQVVRRLVAGPNARWLHQQRFAQRYLQANIDEGSIDDVVSAKGRASWETGIMEISQGFAGASATLSTPARQVQALYGAIAGRPADAAALAYWQPRVADFDVRSLTHTLLRSESYRGRVVDERYRQILGRAPDPSGRAYWMGRLATPGGEQAMVVAMLTSQSFTSAAIS